MAVQHEVKKLVIELAPANPGDAQPDSFEAQLEAALADQNSGVVNDWRLAEIIHGRIGSRTKTLFLIFEQG